MTEFDFHDFTAERLGINRDRAKVLNLSVGYRATFKSVSQQLKCSDREAQNEIDKWWGLCFLYYEDGRTVLSMPQKEVVSARLCLDGGLELRILSHGNTWRREAAERQLINNITQGSAAEIMKLAMIKIINEYPLTGLLVQVYDELVFEYEQEQVGTLSMVKYMMENCIKLDIPLVAEAKSGPNWGMVE